MENLCNMYTNFESCLATAPSGVLMVSWAVNTEVPMWFSTCIRRLQAPASLLGPLLAFLSASACSSLIWFLPSPCHLASAFEVMLTNVLTVNYHAFDKLDPSF